MDIHSIASYLLSFEKEIMQNVNIYKLYIDKLKRIWSYRYEFLGLSWSNHLLFIDGKLPGEKQRSFNPTSWVATRPVSTDPSIGHLGWVPEGSVPLLRIGERGTPSIHGLFNSMAHKWDQPLTNWDDPRSTRVPKLTCSPRQNGSWETILSLWGSSAYFQWRLLSALGRVNQTTINWVKKHPIFFLEVVTVSFNIVEEGSSWSFIPQFTRCFWTI